MSTKYFALLTQLGADKLANAAALGTKIEITHMAVGDGGGSLPVPDTKQTKLINEQRRAAINTLSIDPKNTNQIIAEQVIPEAEGGWWIREIGLYDKDGVLIAVGNCAETYKPQLQEGSGRTQTIRMILIVSSANAVTLKVDPSVVLATREYVDDLANAANNNANTRLEKNKNGADIPDKKAFVENLGLTETKLQAQNALPRSGGDITGDITISNDSEIAWRRNTDMAAIGFKNTGDGDNDSYMWFKTADNGNEYFKWQHSLSGGGTSEWMSLKSDNLRVKGHPVYHEGNKPTAADVGAYSKKETDVQINKVDSEFNQFKTNIQEYIPLPLNLFSNSMMRSVEPEGHPTNYTAVGCTIQAVHPWTKGFEGPYTEVAPPNVASDPDSANENNPYWYGRYYLGARMGRGGLADGWGGIGSGKILKITSTAFSGVDKYFKIPVETYGVFERLGLRFWVKIVKGTLGMGTDSGYRVNERGRGALGYLIEKSEADSAQDGWLFVDKLINTSRVTTIQGNALLFGLPYEEDCEIYLALPYLYVPMANKSMTVAAGETSAYPVFTPGKQS